MSEGSTGWNKVHPFTISTAGPRLSRGGTRLNEAFQMSLSPATSSTPAGFRGPTLVPPQRAFLSATHSDGPLVLQPSSPQPGTQNQWRYQADTNCVREATFHVEPGHSARNTPDPAGGRPTFSASYVTDQNCDGPVLQYNNGSDGDGAWIRLVNPENVSVCSWRTIRIIICCGTPSASYLSLSTPSSWCRVALQTHRLWSSWQHVILKRPHVSWCTWRQHTLQLLSCYLIIPWQKVSVCKMFNNTLKKDN